MNIKKNLKKIAAVSMLAGLVSSGKMNNISSLSMSNLGEAVATLGGMSAFFDLGCTALTGKSGMGKFIAWMGYPNGIMNGKVQNGQ